MDESQFLTESGAAFAKLLRVFDALDPDVAEAETQAGVLTISFATGVKLVLNTQRPTRQIWMAGAGQAWHFAFDRARELWLDTKQNQELMASVRSFAAAQNVVLASDDR